MVRRLIERVPADVQRDRSDHGGSSAWPEVCTQGFCVATLHGAAEEETSRELKVGRHQDGMRSRGADQASRLTTRDRSAPAPLAVKQTRQPNRSQTSQRCLRPLAEASRPSTRVAAGRPGPALTAGRAATPRTSTVASLRNSSTSARISRRAAITEAVIQSQARSRIGLALLSRVEDVRQRRGDRVALRHAAQLARSQRSSRIPVQADPIRDLTIEISPPDTHLQPQTPRRATSRRRQRRGALRTRISKR